GGDMIVRDSGSFSVVFAYSGRAVRCNARSMTCERSALRCAALTQGIRLAALQRVEWRRRELHPRAVKPKFLCRNALTARRRASGWKLAGSHRRQETPPGTP